MRKVPISCAPFTDDICLGKADARSIVNVVISRYLLPKKPPMNLLTKSSPLNAPLITPASFVDTVTIVNAIATAKAMSLREIFDILLLICQFSKRDYLFYLV